jgi:5-methylcytosine-specific restriction protein A
MNDTQINKIVSGLVSRTNLQLFVRPQKRETIYSLEFWFSDLGYKEGPIFSLEAAGLRRHSIRIRFGKFSTPVINQILKASPSQKSTASELIGIIPQRGFKVEFNWFDNSSLNQIEPSKILLQAQKNPVNNHLSFEAFNRSALEALPPLVSALAELIGYEESIVSPTKDLEIMEGAISIHTIKKRERSKKNRMLCLAYNGYNCAVCGFNASEAYGEIGEILEVHHKQPLSNLDTACVFDPKIDLVPLCPNCHRAVHTKRPIPWTVEELKNKLLTNVI